MNVSSFDTVQEGARPCADPKDLACGVQMPDHDPLKFVTALSAKLATRSRHVCAFLGAGVGKACGLPDVMELEQRVLNDLGPDDRAAFQRILEDRNLEAALSRLRRIAALVTGEDTVDGLSAERAQELDAAACHAIVNALSIDSVDATAAYQLAAWVARANYRQPVELFTVNYDLLLETALERTRTPYFDGFVGALEARFHTELVEALPGSDSESIPSFFARLWKLHGSVNWAWKDGRQIVRLGQPVEGDLAAAIYPSDAKYEESRRVPFIVLQDRLRRALYQPETLMLIAGYSFSDDHLNEQIFDAATRCERSEFIAFCYSEIPAVVAERAMTTPNLQVVSGREAILGGVRENWTAPEDAPAGLWDNEQFALRDFRNLAAYLARSTTREHDGDRPLKELLEGALGKPPAESDELAHG